MPHPTILASVRCEASLARRLASFLGESVDSQSAVCGAFEDPDGRWRVEVHFRETPDESSVRALAAIAAGDDVARAIVFETVAPADWVAASLAGLRPVVAGRFVVHGAHDRARVAAHRIGIEIEAALAFGTGHHGTTRGCLLALDALAKRQRARNVLDVGTGTGVLAIAAARVWRHRVVATDIDPIAVAAARGNARLNRAGPLISFARAQGAGGYFVRARAPYDLILANILLAPLTRMAPDISRLLARGGRVVLSGLLRGHANAALSIYRAQGFRLERRIPLEGWVTLVLRKGQT